MTARTLGRRLVAVLAMMTPAAVGAQARVPSPALTHPAIAVLLPDGAYELTLTPAAGDSRALTNAKPFQVSAQVVHAGMETTVTTSDNVALRGTSSATHLKASGPVHGAILTLELGGSGSQASGTWVLRGRDAHQVTGTVTVAPAPRYQAHTSKQGGCGGFFDCVSQITGYAWKTIFG